MVVESDVDGYLGHGLLLRPGDGVSDTFRVNAAVVPRQEHQAFIPIYGHVFVVLALLVGHKAWGTIALPLLARLYVRKKDLPSIDPKHRPSFRTKLELAVELLRCVKPRLDPLKLPIWVVR